MKKHLLLVAAMLLLAPCLIKAQTGIKIGETDGNPHSSAMVEIESTNRGLLIPRIADHSLIQNPATGLLVYNSTENTFYYYNGTAWAQVGDAGTTVNRTFQQLTPGSTIAWDYAQGYNAEVTLNTNATLSLTNLNDGDSGYLVVKQDGTGNRKLTLPAGSVVLGGGGLILTSNPNATDVLSFKKAGGVLIWSVAYDAY